MKKISVLLGMFLFLFAATSMAQRNWSPEDLAKMKEKRKTTLVDSLGITSVIADSVLAIEDRSRSKMMDLRKSGGSADDMKTQYQALQEQKNADVKKVLPADAYTKYVEMEQRQRNRMPRMGGGGDRANGN